MFQEFTSRLNISSTASSFTILGLWFWLSQVLGHESTSLESVVMVDSALQFKCPVILLANSDRGKMIQTWDF